MSSEYRIVHFVPQHTSGTRIPLGAIIRTDDGAVRVVKAEHLPGAECLGGRAAAATAHIILESLADAEYFDALPQSTGPHAVLDVPRVIPREINDPLKWVEAHVLPSRISERVPGRTRTPRRATWGYRFFQTFKVAQYVRKTFDPKTDWKDVIAPSVANSLPDISHWTGAPSTELLLMEPILPERTQLLQQLRDVGTKLGAYRFQIGKNQSAQAARLVAYVLQGGNPGRRREIVSAMTESAHLVVDVEDEAQRQAFLNDVKRIGATSSPQGALIGPQ